MNREPRPPVQSGSAVESAPLRGVPHRLWRLVALAPRQLLSLDHDGTLAPLMAARDRATPSPRSLRLLARVAAGGRTTLAIVSGRTLADLESRFTTVPAHLVGEYGWEHRRRGTAGTREPLPPGVEGAIAVAVGRARGAGLGPHLECKRASVALHTRALGDQAEGAARLATELWGPLARGPELRCSPFDGGLELAAAGRDKGSAVGWLLEQEPQGTLVVHVGDDESDERAFEAVADRGFGIRVGDPSRPTRAAGWLPDEAAVGDFLEAWLEAVPPAGG